MDFCGANHEVTNAMKWINLKSNCRKESFHRRYDLKVHISPTE